jgi:hypothetical protein
MKINRGIVATLISSTIINLTGIAFASMIHERTALVVIYNALSL